MIYFLTARGTNWLIKKGAKLVETVDDIVSEIDSLRNLHSPGLFEEDRLEKIATSLTQNQKEVFSVLNNDLPPYNRSIS